MQTLDRERDEQRTEENRWLKENRRKSSSEDPSLETESTVSLTVGN